MKRQVELPMQATLDGVVALQGLGKASAEKVLADIYYAGLAISPKCNTAHLDKLLQDFCFHSVADRSNFIAMLLTTLLVHDYIGSQTGGPVQWQSA